MAVHKVRIFLTSDAHAELMDRYLDKEDELRKFIFDQIKGLATIAKMVKLKKVFIYNTEIDDGGNKKRIRKEETMPLKDANIEKYILPNNPDWLPEDLEREDSEPYVYKVGDKTWDYLMLFCKIISARTVFWNKSIRKADPDRKNKLGKIPECNEQILHDNLYAIIFTKIAEVAMEEFDEEDELMNAPPKKEKKKEEPVIAGSRKKPKKT